MDQAAEDGALMRQLTNLPLIMPQKGQTDTVFMNAIRKKIISFPERVKVKKRSFKAFITCHDK